MFTRCSKLPTGLQMALGPCQMRCQNPSKNEDKEYQVAILCDTKGDYYVFSAWGRWGSTLDGQVKEKTQSAARAVLVANEWMHKKGVKGYQEHPTNYQSVGSFSAQALISATPQAQAATPAAIPLPPRGIIPVRPNAPTPASTVSFDDQKWREFIKTMGATTVTVQKYYFDQSPAQVGTKEYEQLMRELFLDAVEAGALQLPPNVKKEDFEFKFTSTYSGSPANTLTVVYKPSSASKDLSCRPNGFLSEKVRLSDYRVGQTLSRLCNRCIATMQL